MNWTRNSFATSVFSLSFPLKTSFSISTNNLVLVLHLVIFVVQTHKFLYQVLISGFHHPMWPPLHSLANKFYNSQSSKQISYKFRINERHNKPIKYLICLLPASITRLLLPPKLLLHLMMPVKISNAAIIIKYVRLWCVFPIKLMALVYSSDSKQLTIR